MQSRSIAPNDAHDKEKQNRRYDCHHTTDAPPRATPRLPLGAAWPERRTGIGSWGDEIAVAIKQYKDSSPGASKDYPTALADVMRDPRMLADTGYLNALPVDPVTEKMEWGEVKDKQGNIIGVHSLSNEFPTFYARLLSFQSGDKYSDGAFLAK